jgi:hypothetical protein
MGKYLKVAVLLTVWPLSGEAYVDPGSGFVLWQGLIAGFGVLLMFIRNPIRMIKDWLVRRRDRQ